MRAPCFIWLFVPLLTPSAAYADDGDAGEPTTAEVSPSDDEVEMPRPGEGAEAATPADEGDFDPSRNHFEAALGFVGGYADYSGVNFAYRNGNGPVQLTEPFDGAPYDGTAVAGMRIELRYVVSHIRTTLGVDLPFANFDAADTASTPTIDGEPATVTVQELDHYTFHIGFGGEYSFGVVTPFIDLLGGFHFMETRLAIDDQSAAYGNTEFGLEGRLGSRFALTKSFFLQASATGGILGPTKVLGELGLGFAL